MRKENLRNHYINITPYMVIRGTIKENPENPGYSVDLVVIQLIILQAA